jgi:hypothetical protein
LTHKNCPQLLLFGQISFYLSFFSSTFHFLSLCLILYLSGRVCGGCRPVLTCNMKVPRYRGYNFDVWRCFQRVDLTPRAFEVIRGPCPGSPVPYQLYPPEDNRWPCPGSLMSSQICPLVRGQQMAEPWVTNVQSDVPTRAQQVAVSGFIIRVLSVLPARGQEGAVPWVTSIQPGGLVGVIKALSVLLTRD